MTLLVAGGDRVDAGKTSFVVCLAAHLLAERDATGTLGEGDAGRFHEEGSDDTVAAFKPRAGNDYWFDHDDVLAATVDGRLYGNDVRRLTEVGGCVPVSTHVLPALSGEERADPSRVAEANRGAYRALFRVANG